MKIRGEIAEGPPVEAEVEDQKDEYGNGQGKRDVAVSVHGHHNPVKKPQIGDKPGEDS